MIMYNAVDPDTFTANRNVMQFLQPPTVQFLSEMFRRLSEGSAFKETDAPESVYAGDIEKLSEAGSIGISA